MNYGKIRENAGNTRYGHIQKTENDRKEIVKNIQIGIKMPSESRQNQNLTLEIDFVKIR